MPIINTIFWWTQGMYLTPQLDKYYIMMNSWYILDTSVRYLRPVVPIWNNLKQKVHLLMLLTLLSWCLSRETSNVFWIYCFIMGSPEASSSGMNWSKILAVIFLLHFVLQYPNCLLWIIGIIDELPWRVASCSWRSYGNCITCRLLELMEINIYLITGDD